jgi:hypothetical protein
MRKLDAILAILCEPPDFTKEDRIVKRMTRKDLAAKRNVDAAKQRIPSEKQQTKE